MPFVEKPDRFSSDIIVPGRTSDPHGFVTEHRELDGVVGPIKVFFSVTGLRQLARKYSEIGLVPVEELNVAESEGDTFKREAESLRLQVEALEARQARISGLAADGFKVQKVMGRPPEKVTA